jgi:Concanavalin A-like lectin/glucanases superfamily
MKSKRLIFGLALAAFVVFVGCSKTINPQPLPPIHDTVTVVKTDTLLKQPDTGNLRKGLLVYLPFNGTMADSSGNGNLTTVLPGVSLSYDEHGKANSAFSSMGGGSLLVSNNGSIKFDTAYSVSINVMIRSMGMQEFAILTGYNDNKGATFGIGTNQPGISNLTMGLTDSTADCGSLSDVNNTTIDTCQFIPQPGSWYNIISTFRAGVLKTYINGQLISSKSSKSQLAHVCPTAQIIIGSGWGGVVPMNGKVDEFRLYNRVLSPVEIAILAKEFQ